jgi:hypothetical protein
MQITTKRTYQFQTKLYQVEDVLVALGPLRLTMRQSFVLMLGGCGSLNLWRFASGTPLLLQLALACLPLLLSALVAIIRVADRYSEAWALVLLRYLFLQKVYAWHHEPPSRQTHSSLSDKNAIREENAI